jgi:hypothetical protein
MAEIVNLNRVRKAKAKAESARRAERNRAAFGRSKAEKQADQAARAAEDSRLDGHKLDDK